MEAGQRLTQQFSDNSPDTTEDFLEILERSVKNPYDNVYWFARMFVNADRYAGIGKNSMLMLQIADAITRTLPKDDDPEDISISKMAIFNLLRGTKKDSSKDYSKIVDLCADLDRMMQRKADLMALALTLRHIIVPTTKMIAEVPSSDAQFAQSIVEAYLKVKGERGVQDVVNMWDDLGVKGCLAAERAQIVTGLDILRRTIERLSLSREDEDYIISSFVQEFERRVGQKRKGRAGRSLEDVTGFILNYFGITNAKLAPEHLRTSLEIDKLVPCKGGWFIGIACKRTFRERWKQQVTTDTNLLKKYKVRQLWHVLTYDRDLSEKKIEEIGLLNGIIYLPDESSVFKDASTNPKLSEYVRPLSHFVADLKAETLK